MAVSEGKLHVKGTDGVERKITLYTSPDDIVGDYKELKYNGEIVYASTTTDATAIATDDADGATELCYKDTDGAVHYFATKTPLAATTGTVSITGALSVDMTVNGNLTVSGAISSNVRATGTISYGSLTGTAVANATLYSCDIQVSGGTLTFAAAVSEDEDGGMYTTGQVTNNSANTATVCGRLTINGTTSNILYNNGGTFTVANGAYVSATTTSTASSSGATYNAGSGTITIDEGGELYTHGTASHGIRNTSGTIIVNGFCTSICDISNSTFSGINNLSGSVVTIGATGEMTATGKTSTGFGFYNNGTLTIESCGKLTATNTSYYGLYNTSSVTISGFLTASSDTSYGIYTSSTFTLNSTGVVTATGSYGFRNTSTTTISGTLTATATNASYYALYNTSTMTINEGAVVNLSNTAGGGIIYNNTANLKGSISAMGVS